MITKKYHPIKNFISTILLLYFFLPNAHSQQQILVNKLWSASFGNPSSELEWSASVQDSNGDIVTTGNTVDNNLNVDLLLYKQDDAGQLLWEVEYSHAANAKNCPVAVWKSQL